MPIWNVNSIAEYFIEKFPEYQDVYNKSITQVIEDREELYNGLKEIKYIEPLCSHANFILCKVVDRSAQSLARQLLNEFKILVKELCQQKTYRKR